MHMKPRTHHPAQGLASRKAFTLIELLSATAIMGVVILLVVSLTANLLNIWSRSVDRLGSISEASYLLNELTLADIASAQRNHRTNGFNWCYIEYNATGPEGTLLPTMYLITDPLTYPRENTSGDELKGLCAVAYTPQYRNPLIAGNDNRSDVPAPVFGIYRAVIDPQNTFTNVLAMGGYSAASTTSLKAAWNGSALDTSNQPIGVISTFDYEGQNIASITGVNWQTAPVNFLASNIAQMRYTPYIEITNPNGDISLHPLDPSPTNDFLDPPDNGFNIILTDQVIINNNQVVPNAKVVFIEVAFTVVSDEGMDIYNQDTSISFDETVSRYGTTFVRRIPIQSRGL